MKVLERDIQGECGSRGQEDEGVREWEWLRLETVETLNTRKFEDSDRLLVQGRFKETVEEGDRSVEVQYLDHWLLK